MSTAPVKTKFSEQQLAEAARWGISPERVSSLNPLERQGFERKAQRRIKAAQASAPAAPSQAQMQQERKAERTEAGPSNVAHIVLARRNRPLPGGDGKQKRRPGDIVAHPDAVDLKLFSDGAGEPFAPWWGGELSEPPRVSERLYPQLLQRPADGSLWIRDEPKHLMPLGEATASLIGSAIARCKDARALEAAATSGSNTVQALARAALSGKLSEHSEPLELVLEGRQLSVLLASSELVDATEITRVELSTLIAACEDTDALLAILHKRALADNHVEARERIAALRAQAEEAARLEAEAAEEAAKAAAGGQTPAPPLTPEQQAALEAQAQANAEAQAKLDAEAEAKAKAIAAAKDAPPKPEAKGGKK